MLPIMIEHVIIEEIKMRNPASNVVACDFEYTEVREQLENSDDEIIGRVNQFEF